MACAAPHPHPQGPHPPQTLLGDLEPEPRGAQRSGRVTGPVLDPTSHVTPRPPQPVPQGSPQFPGLGEGLDERQTQWWGLKGPRERQAFLKRCTVGGGARPRLVSHCPGPGLRSVTDGLQLSRALAAGALGRRGRSMSVDEASASLNGAGGGGCLPAKDGAGWAVEGPCLPRAGQGGRWDV